MSCCSVCSEWIPAVLAVMVIFDVKKEPVGNWWAHWRWIPNQMAANHTWTGNMHKPALSMSSLICSRKKKEGMNRPCLPPPLSCFLTLLLPHLLLLRHLFLLRSAWKLQKCSYSYHKVFMNAVDEPSERAQKKSAGACGGSKLLADESVFRVITHRAAAFSLCVRVCVCMCLRSQYMICDMSMFLCVNT